ncbi:hypothetical protein [Aquimarina agarivorans]|uniref:hypothetical protein n=1 Tax=Aquimarina agarivorans TaxID=980584 RepID=UPI000248E8D7|nr:hypothetical protein [Aquimarina agarivorans]
MIAYFFVRHHYIDLIATIPTVINFFSESKIPNKLKWGVVAFIVINTVLLIIDKNHVQLFYKRIFKVFWIVKYLVIIVFLITLILLAIDKLLLFDNFKFKIEEHIITVAIISFNIGFIITEVILAREYLNMKRNSHK